ncbi:MAG: alpha-galactosidase [Candidatus Hydrogenedentes bacterium]|nr:alpha-galactosidase [Candidatus Hydrogenedentota bacterium]
MESQTYRIGHELVERVFHFDPAAGSFGTVELRGNPKNVWIRPSRPSPEFEFQIREPASNDLQIISSWDRHTAFSGERDERADETHLIATLRRRNPELEIKLHYQCFRGRPFIRQWAEFKNIGDRPLVLEKVSLLSLELGAAFGDLAGSHGLKRIKKEGVAKWFETYSFDGASDNELTFETGRWREATWLALWRKSSPQGLIVGWETSAITRCRLDPPETEGRMHLRVTMHPAYRLEPGATFEIPKAFVGIYEGDLDEGCYLAHRFTESHLNWPNPGDDFPYVMFNSWGYGTAIDEKLARQAIDLCAQLGVEVFVTDFGWEGPDWRPQPEIFPSGLAPLSEECHRRGMKFGIHLSFGNVSEESRLYQEHPDWVFGEGCWAYGQGRLPVYALSLGLPDAQQWAVEKVVEVLDREKVDWFLTDTHLWGHANPKKHTLTADQDYLAATGFESVMAEIHSRRPQVLMEHCDGGLSLPNYKMLQQHVTTITCDNAGALETRLSVYDLSRVLPPRYLDKYQQEWRSHYANRSCMFGGPWILMTPIHTLEPGSSDWNELVEDIRLYKQYRSRIRDGKVLHLVEPNEPADPTWDGWDAIGTYHPGEDAAIVFAFRTQGKVPTHTIPMKCLHPRQKYVVHLVDTDQRYTATGREIMRKGLTLELDAYAENPHAHCSEIILIEPAA